MAYRNKRRLDDECLRTTEASGPREQGVEGVKVDHHLCTSSVRLDDIVVVIAEDDDDIRFALAEFLNQKGATVFACHDARTALEAVRAHCPDLVLSDIGLPNRDGFELLQDIRSLNSGESCDVPVIAMTALEGVVHQNPTIDTGFQATLRKPFKPDQLLSAVALTLNCR